MRFGAIVIAVLTASLSASAADPFVGKWKLTSSTITGTQIGSVSTFEEIPNGIRFTASAHKVDLVADDKEQAPGGGRMTTSVGADARFVKRPNSRTIEVIYRRKGKDVATMKREISEDGRVLTVTADGVNPKGAKVHSVEVYEKE